MQDFDAALKLLLQASAPATLRAVTGEAIQKWLHAELPPGGTLRADLLGETADGTLVHLELQTKNDEEMAWRMAHYAFRIHRMYNRFPRQFVYTSVERQYECLPNCVFRGSVHTRRHSRSRWRGTAAESGDWR